MKRKTIKFHGEVDGTNFNNSHRAGAVPKYFRQTALIYFRCDSVTDDERLTIYEDFANTFRGEKTLQGCIRDDLKVWRLQLYLVIAVTFNCFSKLHYKVVIISLCTQVCQDYDIKAFRYIICSIYKKVCAISVCWSDDRYWHKLLTCSSLLVKLRWNFFLKYLRSIPRGL